MNRNRIIPQMCDVRPVDQTGDLDWKKIQSIEEQGRESRKRAVMKDSGIEESAKAYILGVGIESRNAPIFHDAAFNIDEFFQDKDEYERYLPENQKIILQENERRMRSERERREEFIQQQRAEKEKHERMIFETEKRRYLPENQKIILQENERCMLAERERREVAIRSEKENQDQQKRILLEMEQRRLKDQQRVVLEKIQILHKEKEAEMVAEKTRQQREREELARKEALQRQGQLRSIAQSNRQRQVAYTEAVMLEREKRNQEQAKWLEEELKLEAEAEARANKEKRIVENRIKRKKAFSHFASFFNAKAKLVNGIKSDYNNGNEFSLSDIFFPPHFSFQFDARKALFAFAAVALSMSLGFGGISYASRGLGLKGRVLGVSQDGFSNLSSAISDMSNQNFEGSARQFSEAYANFARGSQELEDMGGLLLDVTRFIPFASKISSGKNAVEAGKHFSAAGQAINEVVKVAAQLKNSVDNFQQSGISLLDVFASAEKNITEAKKELDAAQQNVDKISVDDLPQDKREKFLLLKQNLPDIRSALDLFLNNSHIFADMLGGNGPRKYLFLFQNNSEMRATGGFIGSYGLLDIANGHVKKFFIDGIFNPDGQLKEKIVPPEPIQKISATWSLHDSNWFADFPVSAKKAIQFYEKTGGPTVDGVITLTPTLMQELLKITGPIEMSEYGVTLNSENFTELTQYEVEVDYDKEENKPKKILSDLAPLVLEKLLSGNNMESASKTIDVFLSGLNEKHILLYSENPDLEKIISQQGWSGEIIPTAKDYISVINTNVNGFKTDAVVEESINHKAEIQIDGSIVDTVTITRKHTGGNSEYEWFNKVNADYMRVYVPQGSKLLEVDGQTKETNNPPLDYDALGFKRDVDVQNEEKGITIDPESGTRIYDEDGKTVFANWTYVSPQETMTISYKYVLPFTLFKVLVGQTEQADSYSLVAQKQSGSIGSSFVSTISYPSKYMLKWDFPEDAEKGNGELKKETDLTVDRFIGAAFEKH